MSIYEDCKHIVTVDGSELDHVMSRIPELKLIIENAHYPFNDPTTIITSSTIHSFLQCVYDTSIVDEYTAPNLFKYFVAGSILILSDTNNKVHIYQILDQTVGDDGTDSQSIIAIHWTSDQTEVIGIEFTFDGVNPTFEDTIVNVLSGKFVVNPLAPIVVIEPSQESQQRIDTQQKEDVRNHNDRFPRTHKKEQFGIELNSDIYSRIPYIKQSIRAMVPSLKRKRSVE